jgi:FlaA1/EpsC-like NDP-sugar epimerase
MESQPGEAIRNNVLGTAQVAELAYAHGVSRFVMISTDKAINPTNVMGATKRVAEAFIQSMQTRGNMGTRFAVVRFGNVLGSSGSVVPTFARQIAEGGPVKVTHPDITRYFMTIPEAVSLVLQSAARALGGEIYLLDMGKPIKIVDLARQMIELNGLSMGSDISVEFTGLRPGEKLYEELYQLSEDVTATDHPKIVRLVTTPPSYSQMNTRITRLAAELHVSGPDDLKLLLKTIVPEYSPQFAACSNEARRGEPCSPLLL